MNIAILGGSFDPPHIGHLLVALQVVELTDTDQVWLVPCHTHPFDKQMSPAKTRLEMTLLMESEVIKINDYESTQKQVSYSIDTLKAFSELYKNHKFSWIIGSDQVKDFHKWKDWQKIIEDFGLIVFPRGTEKYDASIPPSMKVISADETIVTSISSSIVRQRVKKHQSIIHLVTPEVASYITSHTLYL